MHDTGHAVTLLHAVGRDRTGLKGTEARSGHPREDRIEAHVFVAFIANWLYVTLKKLARPQISVLNIAQLVDKVHARPIVVISANDQ